MEGDSGPLPGSNVRYGWTIVLCLRYTPGMDESPPTEKLLLLLPPEQKAWLKTKADELDRSMNSVVRQLIARGMKAEGK